MQLLATIHSCKRGTHRISETGYVIFISNKTLSIDKCLNSGRTENLLIKDC
jgi:hypothetical protein